MNAIETILCGALLASPPASCLAQVQEAWVARYNGGFVNKSNAPVAAVLDAAGNICVAGSSQNAGGLFEYMVLRYSPAGTPFPAARYSSNPTRCVVSDLALDQAGNAYVTGSGGTAKFGTNGDLSWTAPYAGNGLAVDTNSGNTYVTGFSTNEYATVKLDAGGSNLWVRTYVSVNSSGQWPNASQQVATDTAGNVYVAGWETWGPPFWCDGQRTSMCRYSQPSMLKYDSGGSCLWTNAYSPGPYGAGRTKALILDGQGGVYVAGTGDGGLQYLAARLDTSGGTRWYEPLVSLPLTSATVGGDGCVYVTGIAWWTVRLAPTDGQVLWTAYRQLSERASTIATDARGSVYVAGVVTSQTNGNDSALVRYDPANGNQLWTKRYDGPAHGDDGAVAMAIAPDGSIYVTGYSANTNGGTDIFVIKYVPTASIQRQSNSMLLQFSGLPGQTCGLEASTDLVSWATLGLVTADTNGVFQFADTNAPFFTRRLYRWHYP